LSALQQRFAGGKAQVVGILCDSVYALKAWAESMGGVSYPLCSDFWPHGKVTRTYGVFNEELGRPERAIIVVDGEGAVRYIDVHTLREVPDEEEIADELKRLDPSASG
jgi:alkyl hydroperoxide reductase subunit AhpC